MPTPWERYREAQLDIEEYEIFHDVPDPIPGVQEAARLAWENCAPHERPGALVQAFNRVRQGSGPIPQLTAPRNTGRIAPVSEPLNWGTPSWINSVRDEMFADVEQARQPLEDEEDDEDATIARKDQALYQLRLMARQKESE